ncbi:MAG: hypothetical protein WC254_03565 [Candidatus Woesearchaeota archaeon]|jgi:hypothetical protein
MKKLIIFCIVLFLFTFLHSCKSNTVPVFIEFNATCDYKEIIPHGISKEFNATEFVIVLTNATFKEINDMTTHPCVIRVFSPKQIRKVMQLVNQDLELGQAQQFKKQQVKRSLSKIDVSDKEKLTAYMKKKHTTLPTTVGIEYQLYVTPDDPAVQELVQLYNSTQEIYDESLSWIWVSEEYLNGVGEEWYTPNQFLTVTPTMETNPLPGTPASDCSEQANTLVSLLIAYGYSPETVRVVIGEVNFDEVIGRHAWVEIYENFQWIPLDPTFGTYYDEETGITTEGFSIPYTYFEYHQYPIENYITMYNNIYYYDVESEEGNAPLHWKEESKSRLIEELSEE